MTVQIGNAVHMDSFHHSVPGLRVSYKVPKGEVAIFLLIGEAKKGDAQGEFEPDTALKAIGWIPLEKTLEEVDWDKEREIFESVFRVPEGVYFDGIVYAEKTTSESLNLGLELHAASWKAWQSSVENRLKAWRN